MPTNVCHDLWHHVTGFKIVLPQFIDLDDVKPFKTVKKRKLCDESFATLVPHNSMLCTIVISKQSDVFLYSENEPHVLYCMKFEWRQVAKQFPADSILVAFLYLDAQNETWFGIFDVLRFNGQDVKTKSSLERHNLVFESTKNTKAAGFKHHWCGYSQACYECCQTAQLPFVCTEIMTIDDVYTRVMAPLKIPQAPAAGRP